MSLVRGIGNFGISGKQNSGETTKAFLMASSSSVSLPAKKITTLQHDTDSTTADYRLLTVGSGPITHTYIAYIQTLNFIY